MGFALCFRRSASRLASSVWGGQVRSISTVVNRRPSFVPDNPSPLRPFVSRGSLYSTAATDDDDDDDDDYYWFSSEQEVLRELDLEFNPLPFDKSADPLTGLIWSLWKDRSTGKEILGASFPFKVEEDIPGNRTFTLTRQCNGEHIKVVVSIHKDPIIESYDDDDASSKKSNDDDDDSRFKIPVVVTVTKKSGRLSLELHCRASRDEITVDDIHVILPGHGSEDPKVIWDMVDTVGMDHESLKEAFNKYLKIRGLTASTIRTINSYVLNKQRLEYWFWLDHVKEFLEK